jgi:sortase A
MTRRSKWHRRAELVLIFAGISLLGAAFGSTLSRWNYQKQQERALFHGGPAASVASPGADRELVRPELTEPDPIEAAPPELPLPAESPKKPDPPVVEAKPRAPVADSTAVGRLEIPRLGIAAIVKEGDDERTLRRAVGLVPGSPGPGQPGNMILAGHRDTFFWPLRKIKPADRIRLLVPPHTYEYEVQSVRIVEPEETSVLESRGVEELTLVTCYPFRFVGPAPQRFIVSAARVNE